MAIDFDKIDRSVDLKGLQADVEDAKKNGGGDFPTIPAGKYEVKLESMEIKGTKADPNRPMLAVSFKILSGEYKNQRLFMNRVLYGTKNDKNMIASANKIKLAYNDEKTGKRELFIAQDGAKMNQWGVLQYFEEVQTKTGASAKADALLKLYDQKTRKLTIQNAFGDVRVRAGSAVVVALNLGDIVTNNYMVVNKVTHIFRGDEHMMELDLIGGEFIA